MSADLQASMFTDETAAREALEAVRWPDGPIAHTAATSIRSELPRSKARSARIVLASTTATNARASSRLRSEPCSSAPKSRSQNGGLPTHLLASSKKGMSAHQFHRMLGVTYKTAWFMAHRIREAMKDDRRHGPLGGEGKIVEADETYIGKRENPLPSKQRKGRPYIKHGKRPRTKRTVVAPGRARRQGPLRSCRARYQGKRARRPGPQVSRESALHTDESRLYTELGTEFEAIAPSSMPLANMPATSGALVTSNTIENVFSVFKRGIHGVYQHCGEAHLHRYLNEFDVPLQSPLGLGVTDAERTDCRAQGHRRQAPYLSADW